MELTKERMYEALINRNPEFEGVFIACIKTTGIFCRPTCRSRKPKMENVEFVENVKQALGKGYRACKVCKPLNKLNETPEKIQHLIDEIQNNPASKMRDSDLKALKLDPNTVRRWFKKHYGMTFHSFQRMIRLNTAFKRIRNGDTTLEAAYDVGFDSLSGFCDSFKSIFGVSPAKSKHHNVIEITRLETPLGTMFAASTIEGICLLEFTDRRMLETELKILSKRYKATIIQGRNEIIEKLEIELDEYFRGERTAFSINLDLRGTPFQEKVWSYLETIPYGRTISYQEQSEALGIPNAVRAVANANGMNRVSILIPCHRVIGTSGHLTGYGGGIWRKKWLLDHEKSNLNQQTPRLQYESENILA